MKRRLLYGRTKNINRYEEVSGMRQIAELVSQLSGETKKESKV
jgi:hypothetical protein